MRSLLDCAKRLISRIYWWAPEECWPNEIWTDCLQQVCRPPSWGVWHGMLEHGQGMLAPVPPQAACCPLQSARPHHSGGSCLSKGSPGSVGLAISVAQLSSHVAAALQRTFSPLAQIYLDSIVWHWEALHFISSHGLPLEGDCIPLCSICVIFIHGILYLHICVLAFQDPFWLWRTESLKCNRKRGSLHISAWCISHSFFLQSVIS